MIAQNWLQCREKIETQHSGANLPASAKSRNYTSVAAACDFLRVGRQACHQAHNVFRLIVLYIRNIFKKRSHVALFY